MQLSILCHSFVLSDVSCACATLLMLLQDKPEGKLTDLWAAELEKSGLQTVDVSNAIAELLSVKDDAEITNVKKAAFMTASVMKTSTVPRIEGTLRLP